MTMNLSNKSDLIKYFKANNLYAKKNMGQNFLVDESVLDKIVDVAELKDDDTVLEIGPGLGVLTEKLVEKAGKVIAVEKDQRLTELLKLKNERTKEFRNKLEIINADILDLEPKTLNLEANSYKLVANIPYYITGHIFRKFLGAENKPKTIVMLVQKEVAERICAKPRSTGSTSSLQTSSRQAGKMSVLSVSVQVYGKPEIVDIVKADSFFPVPKVDSAIIKLKVESGKLKVDEKSFFRCVKHGFASKRKTLINNLSSGYQLDKSKIEDIIISVGLDKNVRAQELSLENWEKLSKKFD